MIRGLIWFLVFLSVLGASLWAYQHPGTLQVEWLNQRFHANIYAVFLAMAVVWAGWRVLRKFLVLVWSVPSSWALRHRQHKVEQGLQGLIAAQAFLLAEEPKEANKHARQASEYLSDNSLEQGLAKFLEAQSMLEQENLEGAQEAFLTLSNHPDHGVEFLGLYGRICIALAQSQSSTDPAHQQKAFQLLKEAHQVMPESPWVGYHLLEASINLKQWKEAQQIIHDMKKKQILSSEEAKEEEGLVWFEQSLADEGDYRLRYAEKAADLTNGYVEIISHYARELYKQGNVKKAEQILEKAWGNEPSEEYLELYKNYSPSKAPLDVFSHLERLASFSPSHSLSYQALADASLNAGLTGAALQYLDKLQSTFNDTNPPSRDYFLLKIKYLEATGATFAEIKEGYEKALALG